MASFDPTEATSNVQEDSQERKLHGWALTSVLIALFLTMLMSALDITIVDTAIPRIIGDLHGFNLYSWLITIYLLASTISIPIIGKLSDQFGRKWFMVGSVACFLIGSSLAGTSQTMVQLIIFRGLQGIGAGSLQTLIFTLIADIFSPRERARWLGAFGAIFALASVIGPTTGGWITDNLSWRWVFYINIPIGLLALLALVVWLPSSISTATTTVRGWAAFRRVDITGALMIAAGTICLLLFLSLGGQVYAWDSPLVIALGAGVIVFFALFFFVESRVHEPILPLSLFRSQVFTIGALLTLMQGMAFFGVIVYMPLFIQGVMGQSATSSGAVITPVSISMAAFSTLAGFIIAKLGRYQILAICGGVVLAVGIFLLTLLSVSVTLFTLIFTMIIVGIGLGTMMPVLNVATQNSLPKSQLGAGTGAVTFLRTMGSTLATAVLGTIVTTTYRQYITDHLPGSAKTLPPSLLKAATDQQVLTNAEYRNALLQQGATLEAQGRALLNQIIAVVRDALYTGIHEAFLISFFLCLVIIGLAFLLKDTPLDPQKAKPAQLERDAPPIAGENIPVQESV
jgi:EmrB/QacA subfamily drug resistance transporter